MNALVGALDYGSARMQTLSNNLSNVNTPGYKRKDVSFQSVLDAAQNGDAGDTRPQPAVITDGSTSMRADGNNVDVDAEAARLASTQIYYEGAAQMLQGQFAALKYVISGGR